MTNCDPKKLEFIWTFLLLTLIAVTDQMKNTNISLPNMTRFFCPDYILCPGVNNILFYVCLGRYENHRFVQAIVEVEGGPR